MKTYWSNEGPHQDLADRLNDLVPTSDKVEKSRGANRRLEKFRQASNAYYDIFNNGGGNRRPLIRRIFGISVSAFTYGSYPSRRTDWNAIHEVVEPIIDEIILQAAAEQGLIPADKINTYRIIGKLLED
jgi:hypothetical protein